MLDYVSVNKEWIFSGVRFSVVAAIIFVVRSILNRRRFDGSISTRPFPAEIVRDIGKRPPVRRILPFLFSRLRHLCVVDRVVHLSASVPCLPGTVRWPNAIVRHPLDAARYDLSFCLRFHWHMSLPRIVPFSTALATRRVGACLHFVYLYSYRHDFRRTHDLCSHTPGGQFRVHAKRSN